MAWPLSKIWRIHPVIPLLKGTRGLIRHIPWLYISPVIWVFLAYGSHCSSGKSALQSLDLLHNSLSLFAQNWQHSMQLNNKIRAGFPCVKCVLPEFREGCQIPCVFLGSRSDKLKVASTLEGIPQHVRYYCTPKNVIDVSGTLVAFMSYHLE